jgi:hypothetical protein
MVYGEGSTECYVDADDILHISEKTQLCFIYSQESLVYLHFWKIIMNILNTNNRYVANLKN